MVSTTARTWGAFLALAAMSVLAFSGMGGCTRRADSSIGADGQASQPRYGGSFHLMLEAPGTLEPCLVDDVYEACIVNQLYDGLLEFDPHLNPVPAIAKEWTVSRDGLEYVFILRDDVFFHNGRRVVADDFVYTFTHVFNPALEDYGIGGEYLRKIHGVRDYVEGEAERISGIVAENDTTLRIVLESPYGSFLSALAMDQTKVVAREEIERWGENYDSHPVGTGPFMYERFEDDPLDPKIHLLPNPNYFRGRPYVDELVFHVPRDFNVDKGAEALLAGKLSMCDMPGAMKDRFEKNPRFRILRRPELSFSFFGINVEMEPFRDVRVRRAIAHAIDRDKIMQLDPVGRIPARGILPPGMFGYSPEAKTLPFDPDRARELLAEAGYPNGEGLPAVEYWQSDRGEIGRRADRLMQEDLAAVGIDIVFKYVDWDEFDTGLTGRTIACFGLTWVADVPDPDSFLASLFMTGGYNLFNYSSPVVDSLLFVGSRMKGSRERADVYRKAERIILRDVPVVPLFHIANNYAVRDEVRSLVVTPLGLGSLQLERVWLRPPAS